MTSHWKFSKRSLPTEPVRASTFCTFEPERAEPITIRLRSDATDANGDVKGEHFTIHMSAPEAREIATQLQRYVDKLTERT